MKIQQNILLIPYTTFKIGGRAKYFCRVETVEELEEALGFAKKNSLSVFVLGGGSNLLISDQGFNGLVIKVVSGKLSVVSSTLEADAGVPLGRIVTESTSRGLAGLEWAAGIPGTLGGAVRGNAGAFGGSMQDIVESVTAFNIKTGRARKFKNEAPCAKSAGYLERNSSVVPPQGGTKENKDCAFVYRGSIFKKNPNLVVWSAKLSLKNGNREQLKKFIKEKTLYRLARLLQ